MRVEIQKSTLWDIVKAICTVIAVAVFSVKLFMIPTSLTIDFPVLLSLLLALFSVGLAALFYFKATDSSNRFYDNTHKFTRDISQLLSKMESGFGERLRNLDEGYTSMRGYFQVERQVAASSDNTEAKDFEIAKSKLEEENREYKRTVNERSIIIDELIEKSQLDQAAKEEISTRLKAKESEIVEMQNEMKKLNRAVTLARFQSQKAGDEKHTGHKQGMDRYAKKVIVNKIGADVIRFLSTRDIKQEFESLEHDLNNAFVADLQLFGYLENRTLTSKGVDYIRELAFE